MNEAETIDIINSKYKTNLKLVTDQFSEYDAEDENYICEVKNRRDYYEAKLIECLKMFKNYQKAQLRGKSFIYVVTDKKGIFIFNITDLISYIVENVPIKQECPATTDFGRNDKIAKYSYFLTENSATFIPYD